MALRRGAAPLLLGAGLGAPLKSAELLLQLRAQQQAGASWALGSLLRINKQSLNNAGSAALSSLADRDQEDGRCGAESSHIRLPAHLLPALRLGPLAGHASRLSSPIMLPLILQAHGMHTSALAGHAAGQASTNKPGSASPASGKAVGPGELAAADKPLPDAEDADQAISQYEDLSTRLAKLNRPASVRTWDQVVRDLLLGIANILVGTVKFTASVPGRIKRFRAMPKDVWDKKKADLWASVKHEAHHYWVSGMPKWRAGGVRWAGVARPAGAAYKSG